MVLFGLMTRDGNSDFAQRKQDKDLERVLSPTNLSMLTHSFSTQSRLWPLTKGEGARCCSRVGKKENVQCQLPVSNYLVFHYKKYACLAFRLGDFGRERLLKFGLVAMRESAAPRYTVNTYSAGECNNGLQYIQCKLHALVLNFSIWCCVFIIMIISEQR